MASTIPPSQVGDIGRPFVGERCWSSIYLEWAPATHPDINSQLLRYEWQYRKDSGSPWVPLFPDEPDGEIGNPTERIVRIIGFEATEGAYLRVRASSYQNPGPWREHGPFAVEGQVWSGAGSAPGLGPNPVVGLGISWPSLNGEVYDKLSAESTTTVASQGSLDREWQYATSNNPFVWQPLLPLSPASRQEFDVGGYPKNLSAYVRVRATDGTWHSGWNVSQQFKLYGHPYYYVNKTAEGQNPPAIVVVNNVPVGWTVHAGGVSGTIKAVAGGDKVATLNFGSTPVPGWFIITDTTDVQRLAYASTSAYAMRGGDTFAVSSHYDPGTSPNDDPTVVQVDPYAPEPAPGDPCALAYLWEYRAVGSPAWAQFSTDKNPTFPNFQEAIEVRLTVTDEGGLSDSVTHTIQPQAPWALCADSPTSRQFGSAERSILAARGRRVAVRVLMEDDAGAIYDLTQRMGKNDVLGVDVTASIDQPVMSASVELFRQEELTLFGLGAGWLDLNRKIVIQTATTAPDTAPTLADYRCIFSGYTDSVDMVSPIRMEARDEFGRLMDRHIDAVRSYGPGPLETVMQGILTDNPLYNKDASTTPVPLFVSTEYPPTTFDIPAAFDQQPYIPLMEAMQPKALRAGGADVRGLWYADGTFRLTYYLPPRGKTVVDYQMLAADILSVRRLSVNNQDIRNIGKGSWTDGAGATQTLSGAVVDTVSRNRHGHRLMVFDEGTDSGIRTEAQFVAYLNAAVWDLREPWADFEVEVHFLWAVALHWLIGFEALPGYTGEPRTFAVVGFRHSLRAGQWRTHLTLRYDKPVGSVRGWIQEDTTTKPPAERPPEDTWTAPTGGGGGGGGVGGGETEVLEPAGTA